ncbi:hypothetical protein JCM11491_000336, partial [Sporobolomyces phaffii]
QRNKQPAGKSG